MSTKNLPGKFDCFNKAAPNEPMFVLLGRDVCAPFAVLFWSKMRTLLEGPSEQTAEAQECASAMRDWAITLKKDDKMKLAYDAFRAACSEVAQADVKDEK